MIIAGLKLGAVRRNLRVSAFSGWTEGFLYPRRTSKILQLLVWWNPPKTNGSAPKPPEGTRTQRWTRCFPEKFDVSDPRGSAERPSRRSLSQLRGTSAAGTIRSVWISKICSFKRMEASQQAGPRRGKQTAVGLRRLDEVTTRRTSLWPQSPTTPPSVCSH